MDEAERFSSSVFVPLLFHLNENGNFLFARNLEAKTAEIKEGMVLQDSPHKCSS